MSGDLKKIRGERIRSLRKEAGFTLKDLSEKLGITYQSIREWEIGKTSPSGDHIETLARIFRVSPSWIWSGQGSKYLEDLKDTVPPRREEIAEVKHKQEIKKLILILESGNQTAIGSIRNQIDTLYKICKEELAEDVVEQKRGA